MPTRRFAGMLGLAAVMVLLIPAQSAWGATNTWTGTWSTSWTGSSNGSATMIFEQTPDSIVSGEASGPVSGSGPSFVGDGFFAALEAPDTLVGEWADDAGNGGTFTLTLSGDGQSWSGTWAEDGGGSWSATCIDGACLDNTDQVVTPTGPEAEDATSCGPTGPGETVTVVDTGRTYALLAGGTVSDEDFRVYEIDWGDGTTETLDNRDTDDEGARLGSAAFHAYDADGEYEVTVTLIEGNSSTSGPCLSAAATWTVAIDSSGTSEVAVATVIGSGAAVDDARFDGEYAMDSIITGIQDPDGILGGGYGEGFIGSSYSVVSSFAAPMCDVDPCDTTWDMFSSSNPRLYAFDGTTYRKLLTWGEISGNASSCPADGVASITELQVVGALVVGDRTVATELSGVHQRYSRLTSDCIPFPTYSEAWSVHLTSTALAALAEEQAALEAAELAAAEGDAVEDDPTQEDGGAADPTVAIAPTQDPDDDRLVVVGSLFDAGRSNFVASIPTLAELPKAADDLASSALIALAMAILIIFPAQVFNSTFSTHYDDIAAGTRRRLPWLFALFPVEGEATEAEAGSGPFERVVMGKLLMLIAAAAVLKVFLDPQVGVNKATLLTVLGFLSGLAIYLVVATLIGLRLGRELGRTDAYFKLLPGSLLIGLICVIISRSVGFLPGYLYVFVGSLTFREKLDAEGNARNASIAAVTLLVLGVLGWLALGPVAAGVESSSSPGVGALWLESTLAATFAIGIHSALFRMIPITFMAGHKVWTVSRWRWAVIYAPVAFMFVHISGQRGGGSTTVDWATTLSLFGLFGLASLLFWAYWRNRGRRSTPGVPKESARA